MKTFVLTYGCKRCESPFWNEIQKAENIDLLQGGGTDCPQCREEIPIASNITEV